MFAQCLRKGFVTRAGGSSIDFRESVLTTDNQYHDLDLSSIIPLGAKAALIHCRGETSDIAGIGYLKRKGQLGAPAHCVIRPQIADHAVGAIVPVALEAARIVEYKFSNVTWDYISITIKAWFF